MPVLRPPANKRRTWDAEPWIEASRAWVESCFSEPGGCALLYERMQSLYAVKWRRHTEADDD